MGCTSRRGRGHERRPGCFPSSPGWPCTTAGSRPGAARPRTCSAARTCCASWKRSPTSRARAGRQAWPGCWSTASSWPSGFAPLARNGSRRDAGQTSRPLPAACHRRAGGQPAFPPAAIVGSGLAAHPRPTCSPDWMHAFLALRNYVSTARTQGLNPLAFPRQVFEGQPWLPAPQGPEKSQEILRCVVLGFGSSAQEVRCCLSRRRSWSRSAGSIAFRKWFSAAERLPAVASSSSIPAAAYCSRVTTGW
jgi:hypothetical protein